MKILPVMYHLDKELLFGSHPDLDSSAGSALAKFCVLQVLLFGALFPPPIYNIRLSSWFYDLFSLFAHQLFSLAGRANSITDQKLSVCMSVC